MSRLDTVRTFFIEQFLNAISADPRLSGLSRPIELFDATGQYNVTVDAAGFRRIPTPQNIRQRIAASNDNQEKQELTVFLEIVLGASAYLTGGLGTLNLATLKALATAFSPFIRQNVNQSFVPTAVESYLNYSDGTLRATYHDENAAIPLPGNIFDLMFENPAIPLAPAFSEDPYVARIPFVSTVGIDPSTIPYPASPLSVGRLNLSAADPRFTPGQQVPTIYAELKSLTGSLLLNRLYDNYAAQPGRFAPLRNNRIHLDPLINYKELIDTAGARASISANSAAAAPTAASEEASENNEPAALRDTTRLIRAASRFLRLDPSIVEERFSSIRETLADTTALTSSLTGMRRVTASISGIVDVTPRTRTTFLPSRSPLLLVYHAFYPADDEARKRGSISSTNREGHHLATGIMFMPFGRSHNNFNMTPSHVFYCDGPDDIRIYPFDHPILQKLDDQGADDPQGRHLVIYSKWNSPLAFIVGGLVGGGTAIIAKKAGASDAYVAALSTLAGIAASAAVSGLWPVAAAAAVLFLVVLLICIFTGCGSSDSSSSTDSAPGTISTPLSADPDYQDPSSHLTPPGSPAAGTAMHIGIIPHLLERNLYGLHGGGAGTFDIVDDPALKEMLGWVGFPGGIGYQLDREMPGKQDVAGSSWRNYFDLFIAKFLRIEQAKRDVTYFGN